MTSSSQESALPTVPSENNSSTVAAAAADSARPKPRYVLFASVSLISFILDMGTKLWALQALERHGPGSMTIPTPIRINDALSFVLARNYGGAWGLLRTADDAVRKPFFVIVTLIAIAFILYLYRRVHPQQHALQWGLPMVLGGAVGNLADRIRLGWVVDFIDYQAEWVRTLNGLLAKISGSHAVTNHWPTFNVADIAITVGVILMAVDMFVGRRHVDQEKERGSKDEDSSEQVLDEQQSLSHDDESDDVSGTDAPESSA